MSVTSLVKTVRWQACLKKGLPVKQISVLRCLHSRDAQFHGDQSQRSKFQPRQSDTKQRYDQLLSLRKTLNEHPEHVLRILNLAENERLSTCEHIRLGNRGSLAVSRERTERSGQGLWYNFETNESGDMLDLVRDTKQLKRDQDLLLFVTNDILPHLKYLPPESESSQTKVSEQIKESNQKVEAYIARIVRELRPVRGSTAEEYLRRTRRLVRIPDTDSLRYHPRLSTRSEAGSWLSDLPGLVALASHRDADTGNIQVTYLDPGSRDKHPGVHIARRTFGSFLSPQGQQHYCELVPNTKDKNTTFICEGVETALSVYQAFPDTHLIATLGKNNFPRLDPSVLNNRVVLILDNDSVNLSGDRIFHATTRKLLEHGKDVHYVQPPLLDGRSKTDMNDVLVSLGEYAVHELILNGLKRVK